GMTMTLSWEEAAGRIRELLDLGRYMPQSELLRVNVYERTELAQQLLYAARDLSEEGRVQGFLPTFNVLSNAFDDQRDQLLNKMETPESLQALIDEWRSFAEAHAENPNLLRFRFYRPMQLLHRLEDLQREPLHFTVAEDYDPQPKRFISLDEIDRILRGHDSNAGNEQRLGIYAFFLAHPESKERESMLKELHGTSGSYGGNNNLSYDSSGMVFSHGSLSTPYAKIEWNWTKVRKRIETLIAQNRFLSDVDLAYMTEYERKQVAHSVVSGYMDAPPEYERPYSKNAIADYWECVEEVQQQLTDPARVQAMYTALSDLEAHTQTTERRYDLRHRAVLDLSAYRSGEFSLFGEKREPIPEPVEESEVEKAVWMADDNAQPEPDDRPQPESMEQPTADESEQVKLQSTVIDLRPSWEREQPQPEATEPAEIIPLRPAWQVEQPQQESVPIVPAPSGVAKINFRITDDHLGEGGAKTKFQRNIAAIRTLKAIESEYRLATPEEQQVLSEYVGWGGLPDAFDPTKDQWQEEYAELKELLTPEEYASARASTLNAHYTSPVVIRAMYEALSNMGFQTGNILEPSCGIGNFFGMLPESMASSRLYGVELDDLTGRIAKQLYQNADIRIDGFESTPFPDSFFDVAIGNVPFGDYSLADKRYDKNHFLVHDYFFAKALDKVRPGGVVAFITSSGTMDKANPSVRKYIAQRAELLGAIRLPNNAFRANAGTDVVADILFLQK
ncbi:MAG: N-6 DNA methylase, partial [Clostridia bacterium]|nr:N-6 DNA methylase [Clostridia bacterium]